MAESMTHIVLLAVLLSAVTFAEEYKLGADSERQPGVPAGKVTQHTWTSKIFPGTVRNYWVYVPAQYSSSKPSCLMVFQDGGSFVREDGSWRVPIVFDNLIHKREMPVTIGVFVDPGVLPAPSPKLQARYNRSFEYDALGDRYATFLLEEILPEVRKLYQFSDNANDRAIAGSSSGGIAAFTAAWTHPEAFRRVLSFIGSYVNLRGGHMYPSLIRKTEPKPLRVFLQDGKADQDIYAGHWFVANEDMAAALQYAGYDSTFVVGTEGHNSKHGSAILPDALRWLWRGYPKAIESSTVIRERGVGGIVDLTQGWELVSQGHRVSAGLSGDPAGAVLFNDAAANRIHKLGTDGKIAELKVTVSDANALTDGPDGRLYACEDGRKRIAAHSLSGGAEYVIAEGLNCNDIAVNARGDVYATDPAGGKVWLIDARGNKRVVHEGLASPTGVSLSPDQAQLAVSDSTGKWVWSFQVQPDGSLANGQAFYPLETPDRDSQSGAKGMTFDTDGFLYVATASGLQICDPPGRVVAILSNPPGGPITDVVFGGSDRQTLYVTSGNKVYRRPAKRKGSISSEVVKPPDPRL